MYELTLTEYLNGVDPQQKQKGSVIGSLDEEPITFNSYSATSVTEVNGEIVDDDEVIGYVTEEAFNKTSDSDKVEVVTSPVTIRLV